VRFTPGVRLGPYELIGVAGAGGMGEVYKARDAQLDRSVALKVLPAALTADDAANQRFLREARAASACDHPNICTIYAVDRTPDGHLYLAMAFYEGETLRDRLARGPVPVVEAVEIASQTASGLARAHEAGLVHRDIKPANLMITNRGEVKILDFGLAKLTHDAQLTQAGTALGTVAYMSPEQASGDPVDHRTDIWALGVVLYEMLSGRRPFMGDSAQAVFHAILSRDPDAFTFADGVERDALRAIVRRALERDPRNRYAHAGEMSADLAAISGNRIVRSLSTPPPRPAIDASAATVLAPPVSDAASIAVLPFTDLSPQRDQGWFCEGISEEILTALTKVPGVHVVARTSAFQFKESASDAREIGRALRVRNLLTGGVRTVGDRLRVTVQLTSTHDGYQVWSDRYDATVSDVFEIQDRIARSTVEQLRVRLTSGATPLVRRPSSTIDAYNLYLKGRHYLYQWSIDAVRAGVDCFNQAIALDPAYAQPYAGLADVFTRQALSGLAPPMQVVPKARELVSKALELDPLLPDAHSTMAWVQYTYDWDFEAADRTFRRSLELGPSEMHRGRFSLFRNEQGFFDEGIEEARRALDQSPISADAHLYLVHAFYVARRYRECIDLATRALEFQPGYFPARWYIAMAHVADGRPHDAVEAARAALPARHPFTESILAWTLGLAGETREARRMLASFEERRRSGYFAAPAIVYAHLGLGQFDDALDWYDVAYQERDPHCLAVKVFPSMDPLRGHPRFEAFVRRMHFPETGT
jgi:eukaryotic-like serine/threonine-protein kinase